MKRKLNQYIRKSLLVAVTFILVFCNAVTYVNGQQYQISAGEKIKYPSWFDSSGTWSTRMYTVDGKIAYCLEASKHSPGNGTVGEGGYVDNENLQKVLYYGYGGPADTLSTDGVTSVEMAYLLTHIAASYYYAGDLHGVDLEKLRGWGWAEWIEAIPNRPAIPKGEIGFSKNSLKMYQKDGRQRSEEITVIGDADATLTMVLDKDMELHNLTTNQTVTGTVQLSSGQKFYLSSPLTKRDNYNWSSGSLMGTTNSYYRPLVLTIDDETQTIGTMVLGNGETKPTSLQVEYLPVGSLKLIKTNEDKQMLDGAVFNLKGKNNDYNQDHVVKNGVLQIDNLLVGDYILTEIKTPADHDSLNKEYTVTIKSNEVTTKTIVNELIPVGKLIINKKLEGHLDDLSGIEFKITAKEDIKDIITGTVLYRAGMPIGQNQGIYITDQNGQIIIDKLPMGSYLISEVKTLPGYVFDDTVYEVAFNKEDRVTKEYQYTLNVENKLTQTTISKIDALTKQLLPGATLELYLKDGESLSLIEQWVSTDDAHLIKGLLVDCEYVLKEVKAPAGYTLAPELTFKVENSESIKEIVFENQHIPVVPTGDISNYSGYAGIALISFIFFLIFTKQKRRIL